MEAQLIPDKEGQICKIIAPFEDESPDDVFIMVEDPAVFNNEDQVLVVNLKDLQRNLRNTESVERISIQKDHLVVVGEDLASYVNSWNN